MIFTFLAITPGTAKPIKQKARPVPIKHQAELKEIVNDLLQRGAIEPSFSDWQSPICLVNKPDGTKRLTIDYRKLNEVTVADAYPMPNINNLFSTLYSSKLYSCMDMCSGYMQLKVHPRDVKKTAFAVPQGAFHFLCMPLP